LKCEVGESDRSTVPAARMISRLWTCSEKQWHNELVLFTPTYDEHKVYFSA